MVNLLSLTFHPPQDTQIQCWGPGTHHRHNYNSKTGKPRFRRSSVTTNHRNTTYISGSSPVKMGKRWDGGRGEKGDSGQRSLSRLSSTPISFRTRLTCDRLYGRGVDETTKTTIYVVAVSFGLTRVIPSTTWTGLSREVELPTDGKSWHRYLH